MKYFKLYSPILFLTIFLTSVSTQAQINPGVYIADNENVRHELKVTDDYLIHTTYEKDPAHFIKTVGGFYNLDNATLSVKLEFNSDYQNDNVTTLNIPIEINGDQLVFNTDSKVSFSYTESMPQALDGQWLFATRGPDTGQDRRGEQNTRKTLKYLQDGRFQWVAYDTEGMQFKGTGGGSYTSKDGVYTENIAFFSRDDSRVGASLKFDYEIKGDDWHHTGNNSKGKPMYEVWAKRK